MHMGGVLANLNVAFDDPSALGHGVSPVMDSLVATGLPVGGPPFAAVVLVLLDVDLPPPRVDRKATAATRTATPARKMIWLRWRRRFCAARICSWRCWRPAF